MSDPPECKSGKQLIFTQINDSQFLIEGNSNKTKIGGESEYAISYIDFDNGPLVHVGNDFLGRGKILAIDIIDTDRPNYIIVKVSIENKE
ncbi:hypothetical protein EB118_10285 [bacterium]|nr:hypothetical protein [bacterium]